MYHYTLDSAFVDCFAKFNLALAELQHHNVNRVETGRLLKSGVHIKFAVMLCMRFGDRKIASPEKQLQYFLPSTGCCVCHEASCLLRRTVHFSSLPENSHFVLQILSVWWQGADMGGNGAVLAV